MAITVKDIREMDFARVARGYDMNQVDDFLDEIAEQLSAVIEENISLVNQVNEAQAAPAPAEPQYDENSYFKNLESTLRETLISGQRIADDTVSKAQAEAEGLIAAAKAEAASIVEDANAKVKQAEDKVAELAAAAETYKAQIRAMIEAQQAIIAD